MAEADRWVRTSDIVGSATIARRLDLAHPHAVSLLRRRHDDFPTPISELGRALIWSWQDISAWALANGRSVIWHEPG